MTSDIKLSAIVNPFDNPDGSTKAFASVMIKSGDEQLFVIKGIRVVDGAGGTFVSMPQSRSENKETGAPEYHDIAYAANTNMKKQLESVVLAEYAKSLSPNYKSFSERLDEGKRKVAANKAADKAQGGKDKTAVRKPDVRG